MTHDSPKEQRKEGKTLDPAKIAAAAAGYDSAPYPNHPNPVK